jgi:hypothetical protein
MGRALQWGVIRRNMLRGGGGGGYRWGAGRQGSQVETCHTPHLTHLPPNLQDRLSLEESQLRYVVKENRDRVKEVVCVCCVFMEYCLFGDG